MLATLQTPKFGAIRIIKGGFLGVENRYIKLRESGQLESPHIAALPVIGLIPLPTKAIVMDGPEAERFKAQYYDQEELPDEYVARVTEHRGKMLLRALLIAPFLYDTLRWFADNGILLDRATRFAKQPENQHRVFREKA